MKCPVYIAFALLFAAGTTARSEDAGGGNVAVGGLAPAVCTFVSMPRQLRANNMSLTATSSSTGQLIIDQMADQDTGRLRIASIVIEILGTCNAAHHVSMSTSQGGLRPVQDGGAVSGAFVRHVNYRAEISWAGETITLETDGIAGKKASAALVSGPNQGPLGVQFILDEHGNNMNATVAAGIYSDVLTVQIGQPL